MTPHSLIFATAQGRIRLAWTPEQIKQALNG
jgi:hypothetical protein